MDHQKPVETRSAPAEISVTGGGQRTDSTNTAGLMEMGDVSVETKGILQGLELGYTPKS